MVRIILFIFSFTFAADIDQLLLVNQNMDPWGGYSVSTSDNLDAFTYNPAGFAIDHGTQKGYYKLATDNTLDSNSPLFIGNKFLGLGYSVQYNKGDKLFNATDFKIAFASKVSRTLAFGSQWSKYNQQISSGILFRPSNYISIGSVFYFDDKFYKHQSNRMGLAFRAFKDDKITFGMDVINNKISQNSEKWISSYSPFVDLCVGGALSLRSQFYIDSINDPDLDNMSAVLSVNINFGKLTVHTNQNQHVAGGSSIYKNWGIGWYTSAHRKSNILNTPGKNDRQYIRLKLDGLFIEEKPGTSPFTINPLALLSKPEKGKQLRKWIEEIEKFSNDPTVEGLIIDLGSVRCGFAKKQEIFNALVDFKRTGKKIIVYAKNGIGNTEYYLISMADEIYINELTGIDLRGLSMEVTFYRQLLDTLNIVPEVFRVNVDGKSFKTAGDPFLERTATDEMKENYTELLSGLYDVYISDIATGRSWSEEKTREVVDNGPYYLNSEILENDLVTDILYPDQFDEYVDKLTSKNEDEEKSYKLKKWKDIDRSKEYTVEWKPERKRNIALIYAVGGIVSGKSRKSPSGSITMGDKTIKKAIKSARKDNSIEAIVLRVDSGGGSALASDQMWREVFLTTDNPDSTNNKPFIASMSDVAASGGYYISCQADKIIANESTITGSIGVIGLYLNTSKFWKQFGINREIIVKRGEHADFYTSTRLRNKYETKKIEDSINDTYLTFKERVVSGRSKINDVNTLDEIAMGRVWTGIKSKENHLIDEIGGIKDAILLAAAEANIDDIENINIIEYPRTDLSDILQIVMDSSEFSNRNSLLQYLPIELREQYEYFMNIKHMTEDGPAMLVPYKIEIK